MADRIFGFEEAGLKPLEARQELAHLRRRLDTESYALLELWAQSAGNQSRVARLSGLHRNTIRRRLKAIWTMLRCPIENVSGRLTLTAGQRNTLSQLAQDPGARIRDIFKARLILALASGQSYREIAQALNTTAPTISRWRHRFERSGLEGLKAQHPGRRPRARALVANWIRAEQAKKSKERLSCRRIALALGVSKSTVHRIRNAT
jgi:transposase